MKNFRLPNLKSLQTRILILMKMAESSPRVENTVGKGDITPYVQFVFFPQCFQTNCTADT